MDQWDREWDFMNMDSAKEDLDRCGEVLVDQDGCSSTERKLAMIARRLQALWSSQCRGQRFFRLDRSMTITDVEWAALGDSALFAKKIRGDEGGGAPTTPVAPLALSSSPAREGAQARRWMDAQ